jgi:hypothetical protein
MEKALMRRAEVMEILGLSWWAIRKAIADGVLTPVYLTGKRSRSTIRKGQKKRRAYYRTIEVRKLAGY